MKVEVWADVICPWCYLGRRRFERAVAGFEGRESVDVVYRSFELDPDAPESSEESVEEMLAARYGLSREEARRANDRLTKIAAAEGLDFHLEKARPTNTLDAHRLLQLASVRKIRPAVEERFQRAYFTEGASLSDPATLLRLAGEAGLKESEARRVLTGLAFTLQVRTDEKEARNLGATGVPFYVFDRERALFGAQPTGVFLDALRGRGPVLSRTAPSRSSR